MCEHEMRDGRGTRLSGAVSRTGPRAAAFQFSLWTAAVLIGGGAAADAPADRRPPLPRRADVQRTLDAASADALPANPRPLNIVLLAGPKDHGRDEHDYPRWQARWSLLLGGRAASDEPAANLYGPDRIDPTVGEGAAGVRIVRAAPWPTPDQWKTADLVAAFCYLPWTPERQDEVRAYLARGGGLALFHSATWTRPKASPEVAAIVGIGGFQFYRHGSIALEIALPEHPICHGLPRQIAWFDEPYWPATPPLAPGQVEVLATSREATSPGRDTDSVPQPQFWTYRHGEGRVFGCVPGHYTWTFDDPYFRLLTLRGMAWAAGESPHRFDRVALRCAAIAED